MNPAAVFFVLTATSQCNYDDHSFSLNSNTSSFVLINDSGFFPSIQDNYVVQNIGRSIIQTELWYGDEVQWFGIVCGATVKPGETKLLDNEGKPYYYTGLKVLNDDDTRAIFHGQGGYLQSPYTPGDHFDMFRYLRKALGLSTKYIPINTNGIFKELILSFWPENQPSLWEEILDLIKPLLEKNITEIIQESIQNDLDIYKDKLKNLTSENRGQESYMSVALDLVGIEDRFVYINSNMNNYNYTNSYVLPIYSNIVSMKLHFYTLGVQYNNTLNLSKEDVEQILMYTEETYNKAYQHIANVSESVLDYAYNYSESPGIFNSLMSIRSHLAIHGNEYIPIWKHILENPLSNDEVYNPVISYSTFFGKPTANLYAQSTPVDVPPPLNPRQHSNKTVQLTTVIVYLWCDNPFVLSIGGAKIIFKDGETYMMGTKTAMVESFDLEGSQIVQLSAFGNGKIDGLKFYLSNGQIKSFGMVNSSSFEDFKLSDHYISSFYLSSDDPDLNGQAANLAVSYQWYVK